MKLSWSLFTKNLRPHAQLRLKLQQKVNKIEKHLEHFAPDAVQLKVTIERHPKKYWFTASLALKLPSGTLRCAKFSDDPLPAFDQAVRALLRELSGLKSALRREKDWQPAQGGKAPIAAAIAASTAATTRAQGRASA